MPVPAEQSGIAFSNHIREDSNINMLTYEYLYNGGGVGVGDFNNDGRPDLYFTASLGPNALYLNEGGLRFRDVTAASGTDGAGRWSRGVAVVDINNDGLQDIYVCAGTWQVAEMRRNSAGRFVMTPNALATGSAMGARSTQHSSFSMHVGMLWCWLFLRV